jgi:alpha/beta superfamily hydrolase
VWIPEGAGFGEDSKLEGLFELPACGAPRAGVVVCHPHPLYGGTMTNPVVHHVARACRDVGLATLRFNFRGVGRSTGRYDGLDERHDVERAVAFLRDRLRGAPVALAGYSFGGVMASLAVADGLEVAALALVALAVVWDEFMPESFRPLRAFGGSVLALCGDRDPIAPPETVRAFLAGLGLTPRLVVVPGADHLFGGHYTALEQGVGGFFKDVFGGASPEGV